MSREELRDGFVQVMQTCYSRRRLLPTARRAIHRREFQVHPASAPLLGEPSLGLGETMLPQLLQIPCRHYTPAALGSGRGASVEIQATAVARAAHTLARAAHPVRLCAQGRDPLSLCRDHACLGAGRGRQRRPARCGALILAREAAGKSASRRLANSGANQLETRC